MTLSGKSLAVYALNTLDLQYQKESTGKSFSRNAVRRNNEKLCLSRPVAMNVVPQRATKHCNNIKEKEKKTVKKL